MERDKSLTCSAVYNPISTHTLTWSVTSLENCYGTGIKISTHTLTWSVTLCSINNDLPINISTHTLTWSVTLSECLNAGEEVISTHTLTWSVTVLHSEKYNLVGHFNSHAHVERDIFNITIYICKTISTHTLTWSVTNQSKNALAVQRFQLTRSRGA